MSACWISGWVQLPGALNHSWREVEANDTYAAIPQVARDVARAAADVGDPPQVADSLRELIEKQSVEGLLLELRSDTRSVLVGDGIIATPQIVVRSRRGKRSRRLWSLPPGS